METAPYTCFRCKYKTKDKYNIKRHFDRKKKCPAVSLERNIEMTDAIKEYILENREYHLPKKLEANITPKNATGDMELHYIYLLRPRENVNQGQNVYKIGKTVVNKFTLAPARVNQYGKGSELISINKCINAHEVEKEILKEFNNIFTKYEYGSEYFIGDCYKMNKIINEIIENNTMPL